MKPIAVQTKNAPKVLSRGGMSGIEDNSLVRVPYDSMIDIPGTRGLSESTHRWCSYIYV